jgi:hypothetical protein
MASRSGPPSPPDAPVYSEIFYDGTNNWVTDTAAGNLFKLDGLGAIAQTVTVGSGPGTPAFDGANVWVPNFLRNFDGPGQHRQRGGDDCRRCVRWR